MRATLPLVALLAASSLLTAVSAQQSDTPSGETPGIVRTALDGPLADVAEIIYAVRGPGREWHFYANFGYVCQNPADKKYGGGPGRLVRLNIHTGEQNTIFEDAGGAVRDPDVHYDGNRILFSYRKAGTEYYHLYEINSDGTGLRQLTDGPWDDIECCYAPDGSIVFTSSRCRRYVPCLHTQVAVLHRCDADGSNIRQISPNVETECTPAVMPDGRIIYMRWEYVNRGVMEFHHLWTMNPDGTNQMVFFGNMYDAGYGDLLQDVLMTEPRPVPGTDMVSAIFSDKHGKKEHVGHIFTVSPRSGPDALGQVRRVTRGWPGEPDPEPGAKPDTAWRDPFPVSEDCYLAASHQGIYVVDGQGRFERLAGLPDGTSTGVWVHEPRPLVPRPRPRVIPARTDWSRTTGTMMLTDVYNGRNMDGVERGAITDLLVLEVLPAPVHYGAGNAPIGDNNIKRVIGTVPVDPDGSAHFRVPARRALSFIARDARKRNVKIMNSFTTALPGEDIGCVGCHERRTLAPPPGGLSMPSAMQRDPDDIAAVPGVPDIIGFNRHIQPILDRHCVKCHDGKHEGAANFDGQRYVLWSNSYRALARPWNIAVRGSNRDPYSAGTGSSKLIRLLEEGHKKVQLSEAEMDTFRMWVDAGGIYAGTYAALGIETIDHRIDRTVLEKRCYSCHVKKPPRKGREPDWPFEKFFETDFNITEPESSTFLIAPLAASAGGLATETDPAKSAKRKHYIVFENRQHPDYVALVEDVKEYIRDLEAQDLYGTPGWTPNQHYIREMKRYGILPPDAAWTDDMDPFDVDRRYFESLYPDGN